MQGLRNLTARQIKAARSLLDWSQDDLADTAQLSVATIRKIESGHISPRGSTKNAIRKAFSQHDVFFTENEGVQITKELVKTFIGSKGYLQFLDDIYNTVKEGGITRQFNFSDAIISTHGGKQLDEYVEKMGAVKNLDARCLVPEGDQNFPVKHCVYKWLKKVHKNAIPYFLYGNKVAMLTSPAGKEMVWVVIHSESLSKAFALQFDTYWVEAHNPTVIKKKNCR